MLYVSHFQVVNVCAYIQNSMQMPLSLSLSFSLSFSLSILIRATFNTLNTLIPALD